MYVKCANRNSKNAQILCPKVIYFSFAYRQTQRLMYTKRLKFNYQINNKYKIYIHN